MNAYICDHCQTRELADARYRNPPAGWLRITRYQDDFTVNGEQHFCSTGCAVIALNAEDVASHRRLLEIEVR